MVILVGDVGGTKTRLALYDRETRRIGRPSSGGRSGFRQPKRSFPRGDRPRVPGRE